MVESNMKNLHDLLVEYMDITVKLIDCLQNDMYDDLDELFTNRQDIINIINSMKYTQEEFIKLAKAIKINEFQDELNLLMNQKMNIVKSELKKAQVNRSVNKNYTPNAYVDSIYFNKKI